MKLGADELYSLTPPVELLVVVKALNVFPLLRVYLLESVFGHPCVCVCVCVAVCGMCVCACVVPVAC